MNLLKQLMLFFVCLICLATPAFGADLAIVTPYWGTENNTYLYDQYGLKMQDSGFMKGLFIQSLDPQRYQWNVFLYQTEDINQSDLQGANFIYDFYFGGEAKGKKVLGIGLNYLGIDLAGTGIQTQQGKLDALALDITVVSPYLRAGKYFHFGRGKLRGAFMPWIGGQQDMTEGSGVVDFPGPGSAKIKIDEQQFSWIAGVNLKANFFHWLQFETKRSVVLNSEDYFNKNSAIVNVFLNRNLGISYRYNYQETTSGNDCYNIYGIAMVF